MGDGKRAEAVVTAKCRQHPALDQMQEPHLSAHSLLRLDGYLDEVRPRKVRGKEGRKKAVSTTRLT